MKLFILVAVAAVAVPAVSAQCKLRQLTKAEQGELVKLHNDIRAKVSADKTDLIGPKTPLTPLVWNDDLAAGAGDDVVRCTLEAESRDESGEYDDVGVNFSKVSASKKTETVNLKAHVEGWNEGIKDMLGSYLDFFPSDYRVVNKIGAFTQIIWADTVQVGCAASKQQQKDKRGLYNEYFTCYYSPGGNIAGKTVYVMNLEE